MIYWKQFVFAKILYVQFTPPLLNLDINRTNNFYIWWSNLRIALSILSSLAYFIHLIMEHED